MSLFTGNASARLIRGLFAIGCCTGAAMTLPNAAFPADIEVQPAQGKVYMVSGPGGNVGVQVGEDGVLVVDTMSAAAAPQVLSAIRNLSKGPLLYVIDTDYLPDQTGGNSVLRKAGVRITGGNDTNHITDAANGAQVIAHENVMNRMSAPNGKTPPTPADSWPTDTFFGGEKKLFFNDEGIELRFQPKAHTDGDVIVFFRRSDVICTGDVFTTVGYPVIDLKAGGSIQGELDALNNIVDMIIPVYGQEGGTLVIPGHGRLSNLGDVLNYREMLTILRDRIQDMKRRGMTLAQVKAAKPTSDYEPIYGSDHGPWTTDMFIDAVYQSVNAKSGH